MSFLSFINTLLYLRSDKAITRHIVGRKELKVNHTVHHMKLKLMH